MTPPDDSDIAGRYRRGRSISTKIINPMAIARYGAATQRISPIISANSS